MSKKGHLRSKWKFRLISCLVISISLFILLEYTVSVLYEPSEDLYPWSENDIAALDYDLFIDDPLLIRRLVPGFEAKHPRTGNKIRINSQGYRGPVFDTEKKDGVYRVVFLGGSLMFGMGLAFENTIPCLVKEELGRVLEGRKVEVLNLAVPGYTSFHGFRQAGGLFPAIKPDLVVIGFGFSDSELMNYTDAEVHGSISTTQKFLANIAPYFQWSSLFELITNKSKSKEYRNNLGLTMIIRPDKSRVTARVPIEEFKENTLGIIRVAREQGGRCVLLDSNLTNYFTSDALEQIAAEKNIPFLSARSALEEKSSPERYALKHTGREKLTVKIQVRGISEQAPGNGRRLFLIIVPRGRCRYPPYPQRPTLHDNGKWGDIEAGDGIFTATIYPEEIDAFEFAPATKILLDGMIFQLFMNQNPFYRLPRDLNPNDKSVFYSPVFDFDKPFFQEYLADFDSTLPNSRGALLIAKSLVKTAGPAIE